MSNDTRTASQRIEDLERASLSLYQALESFSKELGLTKETVKLLSNKVDAMVKVAASGGTINDDSVTKGMVQNNVSELKEKVNGLLANRVLENQEVVDDTSFIVARELDDQGTEVNPRLQFALGALSSEEMRNKIKGSKAGDILQLQEGKLKLQIVEVYNIKVPNDTAAPAPVENVAPAPAPEEIDATEPTAEASPSEVPPTEYVSDAIPSEVPSAASEQPAPAAQ